MINKCKSRVGCRIDSCNKRHYTVLHLPTDNSTGGSGSYQNYHYATDSHNAATLEPQNETEATVHTQIVKSHSFLQVIPIILSNGPLSVETNALFECGSNTTLLRKDIAKRLNLEGAQKQLTVTSTLSKSDKIDSAIVSVNAIYESQLIRYERFVKAINMFCKQSRYTF